jgi:molecular chaperone GrpE
VSTLPDEPQDETTSPAGAPEAPVTGPAEEAEGLDGPDGPEPAAAPEAEPADDEPAAAAQVEHDLEELTARAAKADEYLSLAQRTQADFENYRKRAARDIGAAEGRGVTRLARELLPALDNLGRALAAAEGSEVDGHLATGVRLVHDELFAGLARVGIEQFSPRGERFDPQVHEAITQQPVEGAESGTVAEVYQPGYRLGDAVLRPARVVVAE